MREPWILDMVWRDIAFAHWPADAAALAPLLPPGVTLDRFDGRAWLSIVPFRLTRTRVRGFPVLPGFTDVPELNLRTYVRVGDRSGIWFFSLDAASPLAVRGARLMTSLPYFDARIETSESAGVIAYRSVRTARGIAAGRFAARYAVPHAQSDIVPGTLAAFLHERYLFFTQRGASVVCGRIRHRRWTLGPTTFTIEENTLGDLIGYRLDDTPALAFFARELAVKALPVGRVPLLRGRADPHRLRVHELADPKR